MQNRQGANQAQSSATSTGQAQAWCVEYDAIVDEEKGWTARSESHADFALYCTECYKRAP